MTKHTTLLIAFVFSLTACVDLFDPQLTGTDKRFVVEARLTDDLVTQRVFLTYDAPYNYEESVFKNDVLSATVWVSDNAGNRYDFEDDLATVNRVKSGKGFDYKSKKPFKVEVGRNYQLHVQLVDGNYYRSKIETVNPAAPIEKIYWEYKNLPAPSDNRGEFWVYVDTKDTPNPNEYFMLESLHYEPISVCREFVIRADPPILLADECSQECWELQICEECKSVYADKLANGNGIKKQLVGKVPFDSEKPYYLAVRQYSLPESAYQFWNTVFTQARNSGGLFDVVPKTIRGNIENVKNPNEEVLGIFAVSALTEQIIFVERSMKDIKPYPPQLATYRPSGKFYPCEESYSRTAIRPKGWVK